MKALLLILLFIWTDITYAASQLIYKNQQWEVIKSSRKGLSDQCYIISRKSPIIGTETGYTYLVIFHKDVLLFLVEKADEYFKTIIKATMRVGNAAETEIVTGAIMSAIMIANDMRTGKHDIATVELEFENGKKDIHTFYVHGFYHAYMQQLVCIAGEKQLKDTKVHFITIDSGEIK